MYLSKTEHLMIMLSHFKLCVVFSRILVLDKGEIIEYDSPDVLLKDKRSIFYGMAKDAGLV